ncbi:MCE family protein [Flavobacterium amniphilum]|uniref:MlaD family protein n=1 Tax=Flavobacterium amniphilum TaxID=1834035 RepID=UPI00202A87F8|nr:MlaD family protein [Flavobacterium amniphilum]MCL9806571.1 MCE family protein [Flavobacterium amniphilum]
MKKLLFLTIIFSLISCSKTRTLNLRLENGEGISTETKLKVNGFEIGEVNTVKLDESGEMLLLNVSVKPDVKLPADSKFKVESEGFIGSKVIAVKIGTQKEELNERSMIIVENETFSGDSLPTKMQKVINDITGKDTNDSILKELKRLNENLEKRK